MATSTHSNGRYTLPSFYATFLQAQLASADVVIRGQAEILREWFRVASTNNNADESTPEPEQTTFTEGYVDPADQLAWLPADIPAGWL